MNSPVKPTSPRRAPHAPGRLLVPLLCLAAGLGLNVTPARAADVFWSGAGSDQNWSTAANWTNNLGPSGPTDNARFIGGPPPVTTNVLGAVNNVVSVNTTVGSLNYRALSNTFHTTLIPQGVTLSVLGATTNTIGNTGGGQYISTDSIFVGTGVDSGANAQVFESITGLGTLFVSNSAANVDITQTTGGTGGNNATLDLSGLSTFIAYVSQVKLGSGNSASGNQAGNHSGGTLYLARSNVITSFSTSYGVSVGDSPQNNGPLSVLRLGQDNAFYSDFGLGVGRRKASTLPALCQLNFQTNLNNPTALFRNRAGTGPMGTWAIGDNNEVTGSIGSPTGGSVDFSGGTVDALVGSIFVGRTYNGAGSGTAQSVGILTFTAGTITANTVEVGYMPQNNASKASGSLNVLERGVLVISNDLRLGRLVTGTNTSGTATGMVFITGQVLVGGRVYDGGGVSKLTLATGDADNGLLNMQPPGDPTPGSVTVDTLDLISGTISNASLVSALNFTCGALAAIAGDTIIEIQDGGTLNVAAVQGGFKLGGTQTLQGRGTVTGDVTVRPGGTLSPNGRGTPGVLVWASGNPFADNYLFLEDGVRLIFDLSEDPTQAGALNDLITVGGDFVCYGVNQVIINPTQGDLGNGVYRLITVNGVLDATDASFSIVGPMGQSRRLMSFDTSSGTGVDLIVDGTEPGTIIWAGDNATNRWDLKGAVNWRLGAALDKFYALDKVVFDDTGSAAPPVNLVGTLTPGSLTANHETKNYTWTGPGGLTGVSGLTKLGAGTLTVANAGTNDFTGPINIGGGKLQIGGSANRLPTNAVVTVSNVAGAVLDLYNFNQTLATLAGGGAVGGEVTLGTGVLTVSSGVFDGGISGSGKLVKNSTGTLQVSGANTYSGGTLLTTGTVVVVNNAGSGTGSGSVLIAGGTLQIGTNGNTGSIAPQPGGVLTNHGALVFNRNDAVTFADVITGGGLVRQSGSGLVIFTRDHSYTNTTIVDRNNGALRVTSPNALGTRDAGTLVSGGNSPSSSVGVGGQLEMAGDVVFAPEALTLGCRGTNVFLWNAPSGFVNHSGTNTWTGPIDITTGGSYIALQSDAGLMRIAGSIAGGPTATATRMMVLRGVANGEVTGVISNGPITTALRQRARIT